MDNNTLIRYEGVSISRDENIIFENFDFEVKKGDFIYLTGKVGSGKSTLLKTIYREVNISAGVANVLGFDLRKLKMRHLPKLRKQIGIVFQNFMLLPDKTVNENLDIVLRATTNISKNGRKEAITKILSDIGLANKGYKYPHELSGGEQQRVAIGRAIVTNPQIILADEPTANLDEENKIATAELLYRLTQEHGIAVIMATHNKKIMTLFDGKVIEL